MISVSTLLRRLEQGDCGDVVHARCWVLRDRNRSCLLLGDGVGTGSSGPFAVSDLWLVAVEGTARTLRTTQWTRASCSRLLSVAQDDLKDH